MAIYKKQCVFFNGDHCRLPDKCSCFCCWNFRKPIEGIGLSQHVQLDEESRKRRTTLFFSIAALLVSIISLLVSFSKLVLDIFSRRQAP